MSLLIKCIDKITGGAGLVAAWLVIPLILVGCYEVYARHILGAPTVWTYEIGYMLTGAHFLIGGALTLRDGDHIRIDVLYSRFQPRTKALIDSLGYLLIVVPVAFWLSYELWFYAMDAIQSGERSGESSWNPVIWPFRVVFVFGWVLLALQAISELIKAFEVLLGGAERGDD